MSRRASQSPAAGSGGAGAAGAFRHGNSQPPWNRRRRGLTLQELVVVLVMVALVTAFVLFIPRTHRGERAWRIKCASNLRQIGQAMRQYAIDHSGQFPRTRFDPEDPTPRFFTGAMAPDPFGEGGPEPNDVTAAFWLLLRKYPELSPQVFRCPDDAQVVELDFKAFGVAGAHEMSNFPGRRYLSYSLANPYPSAAAIRDGFVWEDSLPPSFAVAGDMNPGTALAARPEAANREMQAWNSPNHRGEGQYLAFADGSVRFVSMPFEGDQRDNVYTAGRSGARRGGAPGTGTSPEDPPGGDAVVAPPAHGRDTVLLPTADAPPGPEPAGASARRFWLLIALPGLLLGGTAMILVIIYAARTRRRKLERDELPDMRDRDSAF